ncbi:amidohydrolase [Vibrio inusitatus NBRC 102082]|uniref:Amidohydrolase n=1 Tax=Vibrio inusitatus NBRC 102082 TaxID=1219070 RepID=A0A4Y3HY67_9VIBR|nr:amidohydrolase family protein [Vibrio inusitatus]GEA51632.1 amidohydrolase [Vibrio inusitatus NBRC 102082]
MKLSLGKLLIPATMFIPVVQAAPILIKDASVIMTMEQDEAGKTGLISNKDILIEDGKIAKIAQNITYDDAQIIDASGKIVMPGLVDVHNHLWQSTIRGCGADKTVTDWLAPCVFNSRFSEEEAYNAVRFSTFDLIASGVTTVVDWSHAFTPPFVDGNVAALQDSRMRYVYSYNVNPIYSDHIRKTKEVVDADELGTFQLASRLSMSFTDTLTKVVALSKELNAELNLHYLENAKDRDIEQTQSLIESGAISVSLLLNHTVVVNDEEIDMMAKANAKIAYNPMSNMRLASGIAPVGKMHEKGIEIGLGLDGAVNDNSNYFSLMRAATGLQRVKHQDATVFPTVEDTLYLATQGGARVLGLQDKIGSIKEGKQADIIVINPKTTNMGATHDIASQIVFTAEPENVEWVLVNGEVLKRDGKLNLPDEELQRLIQSNTAVIAKQKAL